MPTRSSGYSARHRNLFSNIGNQILFWAMPTKRQLPFGLNRARRNPGSDEKKEICVKIQDARFWFSWLKDEPSSQAFIEEQALRQVLDNVIHLLCNRQETHDDSQPFLPYSNTYTLPEAVNLLLDYIKGRESKELEDCSVCGAIEPNAAGLASVEQLGFDLFSIPVSWPSEGSGPQPCFRYVYVPSLVSIMKEVHHRYKPCSIDIPNMERIRLQLRAACCHVWMNRSRSRVAHGNRDVIQFADSIEVKSELQRASDDLPSNGYRICQNGCSVDALLDAGIKRLSRDTSDATKCAVAKDLANLDCLTQRLACLLHARNVPANVPVFDQIVVFEDHEAMRGHIVNSLKGLVANEDQIIMADPIESWRSLTLFATDGRPIGGYADDCHELSRSPREALRILFCFDLEVCTPDRPDDFMEIYGISAGLWYLYKCAKDYPLSSRLIITGHRRLDGQGLNSGAGDLLFKPFTGDELLTAVRSASRHQILWVSPQSVYEEWGTCFNRFYELSGERNQNPLRILEAWLSDYNLQLEFVSNPSDAVSPGCYELSILDLYPFQLGGSDYNPNHILECISVVRRWAKQPKLIVLIPHEQTAMGSGGLLQMLGKMLRDGEDKILHKPIALTGDKNSASIGQEIIQSLADAPDFDVKYVAIVPLMGLVWAMSRNLFVEALVQKGCHENDPLHTWAPLAVLMGGIFGFSCSPKEIVNNDSACDKLINRFKEEIKNNGNRWNRHNVIPDDVISNFCSDCKKAGSPINEVTSIEVWLKHVIDTEPNEKGYRKSFEEYLVKLFGGETQLSFGSAGRWFNNKGECVTDVSLILEFCAKRGILARDAINKIIVEHLTQYGYEEMVLIQEIPIRGYILPR